MKKNKTYNMGGITFGPLYFFKGHKTLDVELVEFPKKGDAPCIEFVVENEVILRLHIQGALELKSIIDRLVFDYVLYKVET